MSLPRILIDVSQTVKLAQQFPNRLGFLISPGSWRTNLHNLPFALDNGRFSVWSKGKEWKEKDFWNHIEKYQGVGYHPLWLAVPDEVGNAKKTFKMWKEWTVRLNHLDWRLALCVQDGMRIQDVKHLTPKPDVIFVGGTTKFKWGTLRFWCENFPRVHVGRVNSERLLWIVHRSRAESSDGTGWFRGGKKRAKGLIRYLTRSSAGLGEFNHQGFGLRKLT